MNNLNQTLCATKCNIWDNLESIYFQGCFDKIYTSLHQIAQNILVNQDTPSSPCETLNAGVSDYLAKLNNQSVICSQGKELPKFVLCGLQRIIWNKAHSDYESYEAYPTLGNLIIPTIVGLGFTLYSLNFVKDQLKAFSMANTRHERIAFIASSIIGVTALICLTFTSVYCIYEFALPFFKHEQLTKI